MSEMIARDRIRREALEAAQTYSNVNEACPYPFTTDAAHAFCEEFDAARKAILATQATTTKAPA